MRCSTLVRAILGKHIFLAAGLLLGVMLGGCQSNPAALYRTGYDKALTPQRWAARSPGDAVVIIGGYHSVWQKANEPSYAFESRQRFTIDWTHGYDVALVKPGSYQLQTLVLPTGSFAEFGGFQGLGAASGAVIASFDVGPGEVVYVGDLDAEVLIEGMGTCAANLSSKNSPGW